MTAGGPQRTRDALGFGLFLAVLTSFVVAIAVLPVVGYPWGFVVTGAIACVPMFLLLARRIGNGRALLLTAVTAAVVAGALLIAAFGVCLATGCVG